MTCANTACRHNRAHLGLPCANEQQTGRKCLEGQFHTTLRDVLGEFGPWDVRRAQGSPYAVMRQRGSGGAWVEVWPHEWSPDEVLVTTGRGKEVAWREEASGEGLAEAVARACAVAGVAVQTRMEVGE